VKEQGDALRRCIESALAKHDQEPGPLLEILHTVQSELGCIPADAVPLIADGLNLSRAEVHGVVSFYHHFRKSPPAARVLQLCRAEACQSMNGAALADFARQRLGVEFGATRADGRITLEAAYCLGLCACAPAGLFNGQPRGRLDRQSIDEIAEGCGIPQ